MFYFGQVPPGPKPTGNKKHHSDPISMLIDGSGFLKSISGSVKKPGTIRIRNTDIKLTDQGCEGAQLLCQGQQNLVLVVDGVRQEGDQLGPAVETRVSFISPIQLVLFITIKIRNKSDKNLFVNTNLTHMKHYA